ncbi:TetR/AcrR family transcriptional regulator [Serinicoccus marinus]|uniref:TetR/AcrR family transcriptional regulator n=1 Tax=Serinicoccus marinus TaxID=247333 RepID=UPI0003B5F11B|nr:TetR family transcriptional regulator [Serinicoccus marinus]
MTGDGRAARGERTREALLEAAAALIAEEGWGRVSVRSVAERAQVRPGVVHYHFSSAEELRRHAATASLRLSLASFAAALPDLEPGLLAYGATVDSPDFTRDPSSMLVAETYLAAVRDPEVAGLVRQIVRELRALLEERLRDVGHPPAAARSRAAALVAGIEGLVLHRSVDPDFPVAEAMAHLVELTRKDSR